MATHDRRRASWRRSAAELCERLVVTMQHQERIAQGEAAQRQANALGHRPLRARLAQVLIALAARLAPTEARTSSTATPVIGMMQS